IPIAVDKDASGDSLSPVTGGMAKWGAGSFSNILNVDTAATEQTGPRRYSILAVPSDAGMIQVSGQPVKGEDGNAWAFLSNIGAFDVADGTGKHYQPVGIVVDYRGPKGERYLIN